MRDAPRPPPLPQNALIYRGFSTAIFPSRRGISTGLVSKSSHPAAIALSLSLLMAFAVRAITGMRFVAGSALIRRVTSSPSISGSDPEAEAMTRVLASPEGAEMYRQLKNARVAEQFPDSIRKFKQYVAAHVARNEVGYEAAAKAIATADPSLYARARLAGMQQIDGMPC
jgi:hypothetical protein